MPHVLQEEENNNKQQLEIHKNEKAPPALSSSSSGYESEPEELQRMPLAPPAWNTRRRLSKQLSMCQTSRDAAWEKFRRCQILKQERRKSGLDSSDEMNLTDEDLHELKGSIELGFGFNEEEGQRLCGTLPALDLYFAVNRQLSLSPVSSPTPQSGRSSDSLGARSSSFCGSPRSDSESWKICSPGEDKVEALGPGCGLFCDAIQLREYN
uniref:Uncharacterized protein n=1 Tax=Kalanchoe fedtschenkoi TaxID=63787 RepID=A0A7N0RB24_KALFE